MFKKIIKHEKNVEIRKRHEKKIIRYTAILLVILLSGGFLGKNASYKNVNSVIYGSILTIFVLTIYLIIEFYYLMPYQEYTDYLIKRNKE